MALIVRTVLGDISPNNLGFVLPHEHVIQDHFPIWGIADLTIKDEALMTRELLIAREGGIRTVGEVSTKDTNHDLDALARVSKASGVQIVGSTGWFHGKHLPKLVHEAEAYQLADIMTYDITVGTSSGVRAGQMKIGSGKDEMHPSERKVFEAAALTHRRTGAPIITHTEEGTLGPQQVAFLIERGVEPKHIAISHMDTNNSFEYQLDVARQGANLSYDRLSDPRDMTDDTRIKFIVELLDRDYVRQILLSHDTASTKQLAQNGGRGYTYLIKTFLPRLREAGVSEDEIRIITQENPRAYLAFTPRC